MTLRARLTVFFIGIVVVPVLVATLLLQTLGGRQSDRRTQSRLRSVTTAVQGLYEGRVERALREVTHAAREVAELIRDRRLSRAAGDLRVRAGLDFLVVTDATGRILGGHRAPAAFAGSQVLGWDVLASGGVNPLLARATVPLVLPTGRAALTGGWYVDADLVRRFARDVGADVLVVRAGRVVAATGAPTASVAATRRSAFPLPGDRLAAFAVSDRDRGTALVTAVPRDESLLGLRTPLLAVAGLGLVLATAVAFALAGTLSRPLRQLTHSALAVAGGNLEQRVEVSGGSDVARLGAAFNAMTEYLRRYVRELKESNEESRRVLTRLGAALESTEDLDAMLGVVLDAALAMLRGGYGAVFDINASGTEPEIRMRVERGADSAGRTRIGLAKAVGRAAATGAPVREPDGDEAQVLQPGAETAIAAPLVREGVTIGVIALYGRAIPERFTAEDLATLASFAGQASVAVDNVLLREEAERLSVTDALTGIANRRSLEHTLGREIERAQRFGRALSVAMIDIDHFKAINDRFGHRAGDLVLVELCRRIQRSIRSQVDTFARYGGEEFVLVLPETGRDGALAAAEKMLRLVRSQPFATGNEEIWVTMSAGVATYPADGTSREVLLSAADAALYRAKQAGRDRVLAATNPAALPGR